MRNPCYMCEERTSECHRLCTEYLDWKNDHEREKQEMKARRKATNEFIAYRENKKNGNRR